MEASSRSNSGIEEKETEQAESFEERSTSQAEDCAAMPSVQMAYPTWPHNYYPQHCTTAAATVPPVNPLHFGPGQIQPQYFSDFPANPPAVACAQPNGGYFLGHAGTGDLAEDAMKSNCVAIPVAHGQGYVLYQTCVGSSAESGINLAVDPNGDLNPMMKHLSLRPVNPTNHYPSINGANHHQFELDQNGALMTSLRPAMGINLKLQTAGGRNFLSATPPAVSSASNGTSLPASNNYMEAFQRMVHN